MEPEHEVYAIAYELSRQQIDQKNKQITKLRAEVSQLDSIPRPLDYNKYALRRKCHSLLEVLKNTTDDQKLLDYIYQLGARLK